MKKFASLILALALLLTMAVVPAMAAENPFTAENPGKLTVGVYDRSNMNTDYGTAVDNQWTRWIQEKVMEDLHIAVEFVAVPRSGADTTFTTMLAGGTAPDLVFWYSYAKTFDFANQGGLYDLGEIIEEYGENLKANLGDMLQYGVCDGVQVVIPAKRASVGHLCSFIRKDWCDKIGYELKMDEDGVAYISTDDLYTILKSWKDQGIAEYPMSLCNESGTEAETMSPVYLAFIDHENFTEEQLATQPDILWPGVKEGYAYMNKLYNEGLIQPDWAQYSDETQHQTWITNGSVGFWSHAYWNAVSDTGAVGSLFNTDPEAEVVPVRLTNNDGVVGLVDQYAPYGMFIQVPAYSEHAVEAVMYLDWQSKYDNFEVLANGFEGEHYTRGENGVHVMLTKEENPDQSERISVNDLILVYNGNPDVTVYEAELISPSWSEKIQKLYWSAYKSSLHDTYVPYLLDRAIVSEGEYSSALAEKLGELRVKTITCAPADFDATYDKLVEEYMGMGGTEVINEKTEAYNAMNAQ